MDLQAVVEAVCRLPIDFSAGGVTPRELVRRSGYLQARPAVGRDQIEDCLLGHPDWIRAWFSWSDDKRYSPAWWLASRGEGTYHVAYYDPELEEQAPPLVFDSEARACAELVVRDIDAIAEHVAPAPPHSARDKLLSRQAPAEDVDGT